MSAQHPKRAARARDFLPVIPAARAELEAALWRLTAADRSTSTALVDAVLAAADGYAEALAAAGIVNAQRRLFAVNAIDPMVLAPCGTPGAYRRHKRRGEDPDDACIQAARADRHERYERSKRSKRTGKAAAA